MYKRNNRGITLVALVVTIIILLILSGITIQGITHNGIFSNAKQAELENKRAQIVEYLRLKVIYEHYSINTEKVNGKSNAAGGE